MITPSDKEYTQTKRIMLGADKMKAEFIPLAEWIDNTYEVKTINIIYDTLDNRTPRVQICFEFEKEKDKFMSHDISYFDKTRQKAIGEKFKEIIEQQGLSQKTNPFLNAFKAKQEEEYLTENAFVVYGAFEPIAKMEARNKITKELTDEFIRSFNNKDIWTISIGFIFPTFFMFTNDKVKQYDKPEIKKLWSNKFYDFVKPFDEFNYFKKEDIQIYLDSKENFDTNYESNWYYYYK